jgi:hypothetical protein
MIPAYGAAVRSAAGVALQRRGWQIAGLWCALGSGAGLACSGVLESTSGFESGYPAWLRPALAGGLALAGLALGRAWAAMYDDCGWAMARFIRGNLQEGGLLWHLLTRTAPELLPQRPQRMTDVPLVRRQRLSSCFNHALRDFPGIYRDWCDRKGLFPFPELLGMGLAWHACLALCPLVLSLLLLGSAAWWFHIAVVLLVASSLAGFAALIQWQGLARWSVSLALGRALEDDAEDGEGAAEDMEEGAGTEEMPLGNAVLQQDDAHALA